LGLSYSLILAFLVPIASLIILGDILGILRIPSYIVLSLAVGAISDILKNRRKIDTGLIEFSWFILILTVGLTLSFSFHYPINIIILLVTILVLIPFVLSYWNKLPLFAEKLRNNYSLATFFALTPLLYMTTEFSVYGLAIYNFLAPTTISYSHPINTIIAHGGDTLLSMLIALITHISLAYIPRNVTISFEKRKILSLSVLALMIAGLTIPASMNYLNRENALAPYVPEKEPWQLTIVRMDYVWLPLGAHGTNYYYLVPDGRYDSESKYYQAWFGIYWIDGKWGVHDEELIKQDIYRFAIVDQNFWLAQHGDPNPYTDIYAEIEFKQIEVNGVSGWFMHGSMITHSDVAKEHYREIIITGFFFVAYFRKYDKTAIVYACTYDPYYPLIENELLELLYSIQWPE